MNPYLSRAEKVTFIQLSLLAGLESECIRIYSEGNNADKEFLKKLRTSHTWLTKALEYRESFLDVEATKELVRQTTKLDFIFVPSDKAKKEHEALKEVQSCLHMPLEDFEAWYSEVIEHTCKVCTRDDFKQCGMRQIMAKYGVYPMNPAAKDTCQFSYVDADPAELPPPRPPREIVENETNERQPADCLPSEPEAAAAEGAVSTVSEPDAAVEQEKPAVPERIALPGMVPVDIYLSSGAQLALDLPRHMAKQLLRGMKSLPKHNRPVCACHVEGELIAVDTQEVVVFRARGIGECESGQTAPISGNQNALPHWSALTGNKNAVPREAKASFKIECKCGADYFCQLSSNNPKARCRDCGAPVYTDWEIKDVFPGTGEEATLMTNRYFVERKGAEAVPAQNKTVAVKWNKKEISGSTLGQYKEPCKIFD